jgi:hypothetical protein
MRACHHLSTWKLAPILTLTSKADLFVGRIHVNWELRSHELVRLQLVAGVYVGPLNSHKLEIDSMDFGGSRSSRCLISAYLFLACGQKWVDPHLYLRCIRG